MNIPFSPPKYNTSAFNCPHCGAFSNMVWSQLRAPGIGALAMVQNCLVCVCSRCHLYSIWVNKKMEYPLPTGVANPNDDLPIEIQADYNEAASIARLSPRGAAALLRLAIQKICIFLGEKGNNLNTDIGKLVKIGLPQKVQQSLDALRVIGNEAVHPGELDLKDDYDTADALFKLTNFIAEKMISEPKEIEEIYEMKVPNSKKEQIAERDGDR